MRLEATATTVSWIPSEIVTGTLRRGFDVGLAHYDDPPPASLERGQVHALCAADRLRFGNVLSGWAEVTDGRVTGAGYDEAGGLVIGSTTARVGRFRVTVRAGRLPTLRRDPEPTADGGVRLVQTVGGRTGFPMPRPVARRPYAQWVSPVVWTTLALTLRPGGDHTVELAGASGFPRHWVYDGGGALVARSAVTDQAGWMQHSFGEQTPWGDQDSPAVVAEASSDLEQQLSGEIMRGGRPEVRRLAAGDVLTRQGEPGEELFLVLDGVLDVEVDGTAVGLVGPGSVLGERALLEGGRRTSTLTATTSVVVAVTGRDSVDPDRLAELSAGHRREGG